MPFETPYQRMCANSHGYDPMSKKEEKWPLGWLISPLLSLNALATLHTVCPSTRESKFTDLLFSRQTSIPFILSGPPPNRIRGRVKSRGRRGKTISREGRIGLPNWIPDLTSTRLSKLTARPFGREKEDRNELRLFFGSQSASGQQAK